MVRNENHSSTSPRDPSPKDHSSATNNANSKKKNNKNMNTSIKVENPITDQTTMPTSGTGKIPTTLFLFLFYFHLFVTAVIIVYLTVRGLIFTGGQNHHNFRPLHFYLPLLTSSACSAVIALLLQAYTFHNPKRCLKVVFWLSPLLTVGAGVLLLAIGTGSSFIAAAFAIVFAIVQSLYGCWVASRMDHTKQVLAMSLTAPVPGRTLFVSISLTTGTIYSCFTVSGLGGATSSGTRLDTLFVFLVLLSLGWTMHVLKNVSHVSFSRVCYMYFVGGTEVIARMAFKETLKHCLGSVCIGSILVPVLGLLRGSARALSSIAGDTDEFMFSCASCYSGLAGKLVAYGNRWGFVHVGVYGKGFVKASTDTWEMFSQARMEPLINSDLTGSFCFLCGIAGGSFAALVSGSWALAVDKSLASGMSIYSFLIGYFLVRIAMVAPQACVSAYHVGYAENPQSIQFDSTLQNRIQELQRSSEV